MRIPLESDVGKEIEEVGGVEGGELADCFEEVEMSVKVESATFVVIKGS